MNETIMHDYYIIVDIADGINSIDIDNNNWYDSLSDARQSMQNKYNDIKDKAYYKIKKYTDNELMYDSYQFIGKDEEPMDYHWIIIKISQVIE